MIRLFSIFLCATFVMAADYDQRARNFPQWFAYWGDHQVAQSKWGVHFDVHLRRNDFLQQPLQFLWRPGLNYTVNQNVQLQAAYTSLRSYPYGTAPVNPQLERRLWQQVTATHQQRKVLWSHRGRFEQRWLSRRYASGETGPGTTAFEQRARYALKATAPLRGNGYWSLGQETFVPVKPETHPAVVDQQRVILAAGKWLKPDLRIEFSYMYQQIWQRNGRVREGNHVLGIAVFNTIPFGKMVGWLR